MKKLFALFVVFLCLVGLVSQTLAMDAMALRRFPVMKTEDGFQEIARTP